MIEVTHAVVVSVELFPDTNRDQAHDQITMAMWPLTGADDIPSIRGIRRVVEISWNDASDPEARRAEVIRMLVDEQIEGIVTVRRETTVMDYHMDAV